MAGIGFPLRQLSRSGLLSLRASAFGYGVVVAAGPWLLTTLGLAAITVLSVGATSDVRLAEFRTVVIYAFAFGFLGTAPATILGARRLADGLFAQQPAAAPAIFLRTLASGAALTALILAAVAAMLSLPLPLALAMIVCGTLVALVWVSAAFCGATRSYGAIATAFAAGTALSAATTLLAVARGGDAAQMVWGYCTGPAIVAGLLSARVLATFPFPIVSISRPRGGNLRLLAAGALANALALWADRLVVWLSPLAERLPSGLISAPLYDGAMFIASLSIIPGLALFVIHLETGIAFGLRRLHGAILDHATLDQIEAEIAATRRSVLETLHRIVLVQAVICLFLVVYADDILPAMGLQARQVAIARLALPAMRFQFVFFASSAVVLYMDLRREYLLLQLSMLGATAAFTALSLMVGPHTLGLGVLVASVGCGVGAYLVMSRALEQLDYNTFMTPLFRMRTSVPAPAPSWPPPPPARSASVP